MLLSGSVLNKAKSSHDDDRLLVDFLLEQRPLNEVLFREMLSKLNDRIPSDPFGHVRILRLLALILNTISSDFNLNRVKVPVLQLLRRLRSDSQLPSIPLILAYEDYIRCFFSLDDLKQRHSSTIKPNTLFKQTECGAVFFESEGFYSWHKPLWENFTRN